MDFFRGKKAFITGGSSGIGFATATELVRLGANVVIGARGERGLEVALGQLSGLVGESQRVGSVIIDVASRDSVKHATAEVLQQLGGIDLLVNNAGITHPGRFESVNDETFESLMQVNYFGTVNVTRAFLPTLIEQRSGHIVNVSSVAGILGIFGYTAYSASKFAVVGFSDCLRQELIEHEINVSVLFPGDTNTPQLEQENRIKPPETKAVAGNVKPLSAEVVAQALVAGVAANRYHILPGFDAKFTHFMYRHFPWMVRHVIDGDLKKIHKKP